MLRPARAPRQLLMGLLLVGLWFEGGCRYRYEAFQTVVAGGAGGTASAGGATNAGQASGAAGAGGSDSASPGNEPPCSVTLTGKEVTLLFDNQTVSRTYRIDWLDDACNPIVYQDKLAPGESVGFITYAGHSWLATDLGDGSQRWVVCPDVPSMYTWVLK